LVIWAALRFGQIGTTAVTFIVSGVAIWSTANGFGPFAHGTVHESLVMLQLFMAVVAGSGLLLGAAITERDAAEARRAADYGALQVSEERQRLALEAGRLGVWDWNLGTGQVQWSENLEPIHGLPRGGFAGTLEGAFLATRAHDLRNPLAPLGTSLELLGSAVSGRERFLDMAKRQVKHLVRLVDDLLDVSRITRGKITLRKEPVLLADVVARAVELARPLVDARGHALTVSLPPEPVRVEADAVRLTQVFANLLGNA